jgi:malonate decarboxylase epsilon subunit
VACHGAHAGHAGVSIACLFPGQGAQTPGFLQRLPDHPAVADTLREAASILHIDIGSWDSAAALHSTVNVQLGLLMAGVAVSRALKQEGVRLDAAAGLSVGAFGAAVVCGAIQFSDALALVKLRAESMRDAYPTGFGMAAITGLDERRVNALLTQAGGAAASVFIANINAPTQIVICGADGALESVLRLAREAGARQAQRLPVSVPSHSPLLDAVSQRLAQALQRIEVAAPQIPYISNRRARAVHDAAGVREDLILNVSHAVRWHDSLTLLFELGVRTFIELPPGRVSCGLVQQNFPGARAIAADDAQPRAIFLAATRG